MIMIRCVLESPGRQRWPTGMHGRRQEGRGRRDVMGCGGMCRSAVRLHQSQQLPRLHQLQLNQLGGFGYTK